MLKFKLKKKIQAPSGSREPEEDKGGMLTEINHTFESTQMIRLYAHFTSTCLLCTQTPKLHPYPPQTPAGVPIPVPPILVAV